MRGEGTGWGSCNERRQMAGARGVQCGEGVKGFGRGRRDVGPGGKE